MVSLAKRLPFLLVAAALASHSRTLPAASFHASSPDELRSSIAAAGSNGEDDTIYLTARVYATMDVAERLDGASAYPTVRADGGRRLTIRGAGAVLSREASSEPMRFLRVEEGAHLVLQDVTLSGGCASGESLPATWGGAILNYGTLDAENCTFESGFAWTNGGAVYNSGSARLSRCTVTGNRSLMGGGVFNAGSLWVEATTLSANHARMDGGAAYNDTGSSEWQNCRLVNNTSGRDGGAVLVQSGTSVTMLGCHVASNRADGDQDGLGNGGGICSLAEGFHESGSRIADNSGEDVAWTAALNPDAEDRPMAMAMVLDDTGRIPEEFLQESTVPDARGLQLPSVTPGFSDVRAPIEAPKFPDPDREHSSGG